MAWERVIFAAALAAVLAACGAAPSAPTPQGVAPAVAAEPLRLAAEDPAAESPVACSAPAADADPGMRAYAAHVGARMGRDILFCPVADKAAAAALIAAGGADLALLDPESHAAVADVARPILTPRGFSNLGRVLTVVAAPASSALEDLADLNGVRLAVGGQGAVGLEEPLRALRDHGVSPAALEAAARLADAEAAAAALRAGTADAAVIYAAGWQRLCRPSSLEDQPCADLKEVWRGRPRAPTAWVMRTTIDPETRMRWVGVHVALHLENPEAFAWIAPGAPELEPTEAGALSVVSGPAPTAGAP